MVVKKGDILDKFEPFLVIRLTTDRIELPEKLPQASDIQKFPFEKDVDDWSPKGDTSRKEFVQRALRKRTAAGYTVVLTLASVLLKNTYDLGICNEAHEKVALNEQEEELVTEAFPFVQAKLDWNSWQILYATIRRSAYFVSIPHSLSLYSSQILPKLPPSSLLTVYNLLKDQLKLPAAVTEEDRILCLKQAIDDNCPGIPVGFIPYSPLSSAAKTLQHSCLPNVAWDWDADSNSLQIVALYDLEEGEERSFSLVEGTTFQERKESHQEKMGVVCDCDRCSCERNNDILPSTCSNKSRVLVRLGHLYFQEERLEYALRCYRQAVKLDSSLMDIWHAIGAVLLTQNKFREAQQHWRDAAAEHSFLAEHEGIGLQLTKQQAYGYFKEQSHSLPAKQVPNYTSHFNGLCFVTDEPALAEGDCKQIIEWAESNKDWTTSRHYAVPTNDVPVHSIPQLLSWFNQWMDSTVRPLFEKQFDVAPANIFVHDAFVVRYEATKSNNFLPVHVDESTHSFILVLNGDFEGGGTYFCDHTITLAPKTPGCLVTFRGDSLRHGGNVVTQGTRYIMAVFLYHDQPSLSRKRPLVSAVADDSASSFTFGFTF